MFEGGCGVVKVVVGMWQRVTAMRRRVKGCCRRIPVVLNRDIVVERGRSAGVREMMKEERTAPVKWWGVWFVE
jgi:hypothetical protein